MPFSGLDPLMDLECVAWSAPLRRFVPALGCELVAQPGAGKEARDTYGEASHTSRFYMRRIFGKFRLQCFCILQTGTHNTVARPSVAHCPAR